MHSRAFIVLCFAVAIWAGTQKCAFVVASDGPADEIQDLCTQDFDCPSEKFCGPNGYCVDVPDNDGADGPGENQEHDSDSSRRKILQESPATEDPATASSPQDSEDPKEPETGDDGTSGRKLFQTAQDTEDPDTEDPDTASGPQDSEDPTEIAGRKLKFI